MRTQKYVIEQLTKKAMELLVHRNEVKYFIINGCSYYMCWLDEKQIAFGSGSIEINIDIHMDEKEISRLFASYIDSSYTEKIDYYFWKEIYTMDNLKKEAPWFTLWKD